MIKETKKEKQPMKPKTKLALAQTGSVVSNIAPLAAVVGVNFHEYFSIGTYTSLRLSFGAILSVILTILMVKNKTNVLKGVWGYLIVFLLAYFLKPVIDDIMLLTGAALLGKSVDAVFFERMVKNFEIECNLTKGAEYNANAMSNAFEKTMKSLSGRV